MPSTSRTRPTVAVVLAGGRSSRFGSDKLEAPINGSSLLDAVLSGLPEETVVAVVGPPRPVSREVTFIHETPLGSGPAGAIVAGLKWALQRNPLAVVVAPADAPRAGGAASALLARLLEADAEGAAARTEAVVGVDGTGRLQPLLLALRSGAAEAIVKRAGVGGAAHAPAAFLLEAIEPYVRHPLSAVETFDIDTPAQLLAWEIQHSDPVTSLVAAVREWPARPGLPRVLAVDGLTGATVVTGDDFYSGALAELDRDALEQMPDDLICERVIDWRRLRAEALEPLLAGRPATFQAYDWNAADGRLGPTRQLAPSDLVIIDGVYSARVELLDLVDFCSYVDVDPDSRQDRYAERPDKPEWRDFWERGEQHYFRHLRPPASFDMVVEPA